MGKKIITVSTEVNVSLEKAWEIWIDPIHVLHWYHASDDWFTTYAENDLRVGGKFLNRMAARDGSMEFDFWGIYTWVQVSEKLAIMLGDDRRMEVRFAHENGKTTVTEIFETEQTNPVEMQRLGWQAILNNFKKYVEAGERLEKLHFEIVINASVDVVFRKMLDADIWKEWTVGFNPASRFEGNWEKGSKIIFLGTDQNGETGGMVSRIRENIQNKFLSIEHVAVIHEGQEITTGPEVDDWAGALENYSFTELGNQTRLSVDTDANIKFVDYFTETWPTALNSLKAICEQ